MKSVNFAMDRILSSIPSNSAVTRGIRRSAMACPFRRHLRFGRSVKFIFGFRSGTRCRGGKTLAAQVPSVAARKGSGSVKFINEDEAQKDSLAEWRWMETIQLDSAPSRDPQIPDAQIPDPQIRRALQWLHENAPRRPCHLHLGLVCVRKGMVHYQATRELYCAVYDMLGPSLEGLTLHISKPELCDHEGLLPTPSQAPHLHTLRILIHASAGAGGMGGGELTHSLLLGVEQLEGLQELCITCPRVRPPMLQLLSLLPPSLISLSLSLTSAHRGGRQESPSHPSRPGSTGSPSAAPALGRTGRAPRMSRLELLHRKRQLARLLALEEDFRMEEEWGECEGEQLEECWLGMPRLPALTKLRLEGLDLTQGNSWQWMEGLQGLQLLELRGCPIEELPALPALRTLRLQDSVPPSTLSALPMGPTSSLPALTSLTVNLQGNHTQGRTLGLRGISHGLRHLAVSGTGLYIIPPDLAACTALTSLTLGYVDAESARHAAHDVGSLAALRHLSVTHRIPKGLEKLTHLAHLELRDVLQSEEGGQWGAVGDTDYAPTGALAEHSVCCGDGTPGAPHLGEGRGRVGGAAGGEEGARGGMSLPPLSTPRYTMARRRTPLPEVYKSLYGSLDEEGADGEGVQRLGYTPLRIPRLGRVFALELPPLVRNGQDQASHCASCSSGSVRGRENTCRGEAGGKEMAREAQLPPSMPSLKSLSLKNCTLGALPRHLPSLACLSVEGGTGPPLPLPPLPSLRALSLVSCHLAAVPAELSGMSQLAHLDLSGNSGIQGRLPPLPTLRTLGLSDCSLSKIPRDLGNLPALSRLDLDSNIGLDASLPPLPSLHHLSMQDCGLLELPPGLTDLSTLDSIDLRGNIHCEITPEEGEWLERRAVRVLLDWDWE